jgi:malate dehydrogenase (oxaloacetate-decarboxylating)(NADP+)
LIGREDVINKRIAKAGLHLQQGRDFDLVNPEDDARFTDYWQTYHNLMERKGITPASAKTLVRTTHTIIAALLVHKGDADAMICGTIGRYDKHLAHIEDIIGLAPGAKKFASLSIMILSKGTFFLCDAFVNPDPTAEDLCDMALLAAEEVRKFGLEPRVALVSHSDFGSIIRPEATKMRDATRLIKERAPTLEVEGEMTASAALSEEIRENLFPHSELKGQANVLIMPNIDSANITFHTLKVLGDGIVVGPLLLGANKSAHVMIPSVTARGIVNAAAYACANAGQMERTQEENAKSKAAKVKKKI